MKRNLIFVLYLCLTSLLVNGQILTESFDGLTFPPTGWTNVHVAGAASPGTWQRVASGLNPTCIPHSGAGMAYYNAYSWSGGNAADFATPALDFSSGLFAVSFWMYRDSGQLAKRDSVTVFVDVNTSSTGGTRLGMVNRATTLAPAVAAQGWYQYSFNIPSTYNSTVNHLIFKGTSDFGNRIYVDDISVYELINVNDVTSVSAADSSVCRGTGTTLYAAGVDGTVYWYSDSCGGTQIGTGDSITVTQQQTTTYFARNFKSGIYSTNCKSLEIKVNTTYQSTSHDTICAHQTFTLSNGIVVSSSGTYPITYSTVEGCDSIITVVLTVRPSIESVITQTICFGDRVLFNGNYYSQTISVSDTLTSLITGCDSVVTLILTILPQISSVTSFAICYGDSFLFNGNYYSQNESFTDTLTTENGCDSLVTLNLTVHPPILTLNSQSICFGDSLLYNGLYYSLQGDYTDTLTSVNGCDSIVTLALIVHVSVTPVITLAGIDLSVQSFASYQWLKDGNVIADATAQNYTAIENGSYTVETVDSNGCRSVSAPVAITGVGISELVEDNIEFFPNPVKEVLMFRNIPLNENVEVEVFNATGELVLRKKMNENHLSVQTIASGVYTLRILSASIAQRHIFVKE